MDLIGRKEEKQEVYNLLNNNGSDLVAVYGRRRVGKTFFIDSIFNNTFDFKHAGMSPEEMVDNNSMLQQQLNNFYNSLKVYGMKENVKPKTWLDAFYMLEKILMEKYDGESKLYL